MVNVLITGVGGPVGQAMVKSARLSTLPLRVVGTDRHALSVGFPWVDVAAVMPNASETERYLEQMIGLCRRAGVQAIFAGSDSELELLANHAGELRAATGTQVIPGRPEVMRIALDKLNTCRFLEAAGLNFPRYASSLEPAQMENLAATVGFPLFAKPRRGSGSRHVLKLTAPEQFGMLGLFGCEFAVQEYLQPDDQEYTVAVFTQRGGEQGACMIMRRELAAGNTYRAWVAHDADIEREARAVVKALEADGPCNVQMRLTARGPVTFEINPRFSGSTGMRARFGYNEVEMSVRSYVLGEALSEPEVREGIALRFWDETYVFPQGA